MKTFHQQLIEQHKNCLEAPSNNDVIDLFQSTISLLFPFFSKDNCVAINCENAFKERITQLSNKLEQIVASFPKLCKDCTIDLEAFLPILNEQLQKDIDAIYLEDPAAKSKDEIVRCYPGFYAIAAYRFANWLNQFQVEIIPRMITEFAHSKTGIDIHPGATIGERFCIDHGTGVVIGETTTIGNNVKLYQGVTLGALSIHKEDADIKRHPTIEDNVVIYANATILGGKTVIGKNAVIGGNVWITSSIQPNSKVYYQHELKIIEQ